MGTVETREGATFGNGVAIEVLNEGGGREVVLFDRLDSQFAHLLCLHRYRPGLVEKLLGFAKEEAAKAELPRGRIGAAPGSATRSALSTSTSAQHAVVDGAASLASGTVLSSKTAPTRIGCDVQAEDFIIAEGSKVTAGPSSRKSFVGQGCQIGKQFSSEGSLFFANCEGFHGEACSVFAGPYTVTHHKSTLLIAGLFSFYNAGSGTNQSNHLYKLGPVHEGQARARLQDRFVQLHDVALPRRAVQCRAGQAHAHLRHVGLSLQLPGSDPVGPLPDDSRLQSHHGRHRARRSQVARPRPPPRRPARPHQLRRVQPLDGRTHDSRLRKE